MVNAPGDWEHKSGYRLDHDGAAIVYEHPDGLEARIDAEVDEDGMVYRPSIWEDGDYRVYPEKHPTKEKAIEALEDMMDNPSG